jgi:hypothetical protein
VKTVSQKAWEYTLFEADGHYYLEVMCGTVAVYDLAIELNAAERAEWESKGEAGILPLVEKIRYTPDQYRSRKIKLPEE